MPSAAPLLSSPLSKLSSKLSSKLNARLTATRTSPRCSSRTSPTSSRARLRARALTTALALALAGAASACVDYGPGLCLNQLCAAGLYVKLVDGADATLSPGDYTIEVAQPGTELAHAWSCTVTDDAASIYDCEQSTELGDELVLDAFVQETEDDTILWVRTYTGPDEDRRYSGPEALTVTVTRAAASAPVMKEFSPTYELASENGCAICETAEGELDVAAPATTEG